MTPCLDEDKNEKPHSLCNLNPQQPQDLKFIWLDMIYTPLFIPETWTLLCRFTLMKRFLSYRCLVSSQITFLLLVFSLIFFFFSVRDLEDFRHINQDRLGWEARCLLKLNHKFSFWVCFRGSKKLRSDETSPDTVTALGQHCRLLIFSWSGRTTDAELFPL